VALLALLVGAALATDLAAADPSTKQQLQEKQQQAKNVLDQVNKLDTQFEASVEAWNGAKYELGVTQKQLKTERTELRQAEKQRRVAVTRVERRLVAIYESTDDQSTVAILFGSTNLSEMLNRFDAVHLVAAADHRLAVQATAARDRYAAAEQKTAGLEDQRAADVSQLDTQRRKIGGMLAERKRLLASVQSQVGALERKEAREQAILKAQAQARLAAAQRAAAAAEAAARAQAQAAAQAKAQAAAQAKAQATTTTTAPSQPAPTTTTAPSPPTPTITAPAVPTTPVSTGPLPAGHPEAAQIALKYLGIPYQWGGASPSTGFDCSGLVMYVYAQLGIQLPHYAAAQFGFGTAVPKNELEPGDLVFFDNLDHVGIYIGGGDMVHAPETGDVVKIEAISDFGNHYVGARRL